jgi:hypothetical protein
MQLTQGIRSQGDGTQFVIAVFDDWDALERILADMAAHGSIRSGTVLHARKDSPPQAVSSGLLKEITELLCTIQAAHLLHDWRSRGRARCKVGKRCAKPRRRTA